MDEVAYLVLRTCQVGATPETAAVRTEGSEVTLPEEVGDECPYLERVVPVEKKKPKITSG